MKKITQITVCIAFLLSMFINAGCSKKHSDDSPSGSQGDKAPYVSVIIMSNGNPTYATSISVGVTDMNHQGIGITGAIVKVNGLVITDLGSGSYTLLLTENPITAGMNVTLSIKVSGVDLTVSAVMPESGNSTKVDVPGCYTGSYMSLGNNI